jgi:probable rRNA maturation factor
MAQGRLVIEVQIETPAWRNAWPRLSADARQVLKAAHEFLNASPQRGEAGARRRRVADEGPLRVGGPSSVSSLRDETPSPLWGEGLGSGMLEVAVVFASDARLRALNAKFRGKDKPTNVLAFENPAAPLGGIALAFETISREAKAQGKTFVNHSKHLILHGFLHLAGYDHHTARDARLMEGLEIAILSAMGIPNPYTARAARA